MTLQISGVGFEHGSINPLNLQRKWRYNLQIQVQFSCGPLSDVHVFKSVRGLWVFDIFWIRLAILVDISQSLRSFLAMQAAQTTGRLPGRCVGWQDGAAPHGARRRRGRQGGFVAGSGQRNGSAEGGWQGLPTIMSHGAHLAETGKKWNFMTQ